MVSKQNKQEPIDLDKAFEEAFEELNHEEERLKAEALGLEAIPSWETIQASRVAQLERQEMRKGLIPKLQLSLQVRRKELEAQRLEARIEGIQRRQEELSAGLEERREEARRLQEEVDRRGGELRASVHQVQSIRSNIVRLQKEITDLKGGA